MGPNMTNFKDVAKSLVRSGAAQVVADEAELEAHIIDLVKNEKVRASMSQAGKDWHVKSKGSSVRIAASILEALR
jgi:3-deoxy-D-manno-octulosonic-acid transferase